MKALRPAIGLLAEVEGGEWKGEGGTRTWTEGNQPLLLFKCQNKQQKIKILAAALSTSSTLFF